MRDDAARISRLNGLKLRALVRDHLGVDEVDAPAEFAPGAALTHDGAGWVLLADRPDGRLGAALVWALRQGVDTVHVIAEEGTGVLARRAIEFEPDVSVWYADGRRLLSAVPESLVPSAAAPPHHEPFRSLIIEGGAEPSVEHGVLVGEVRGLEVCRVVDDPHLDACRLEVGVGAHDREAFQMLHGDVPAVESLARVVDTVARHRRVGAPRHPLNRIAAERFVRWRLVEDPSLAGMASVEVAPPPVRRPNLKDSVPCVAVAEDGSGRPTVIVCSSGVDLDLVPFAADARAAVEAERGVEHALVLAIPARDRVRVVGELAGMLRRPADIVTVD